MGIKNLTKFIKQKFPSVLININIENLKYTKIAIDTSLYICKYKSLHGENWLASFISLICCLREQNIHPCFIFDGKAPTEKSLEKDKRKEARQKLEDTILQLEIDYEDYLNNGIVSKNLMQFYTNHNKQNRMLGKNKINCDLLNTLIERKKSQLFNISNEDIILLKELFDNFGIQYIVAKTEAEKLCAKLCIDNVVQSVLSEDTDLIAYCTPCIITKLNIYTKTAVMIDIDVLLKTFNYTKEQLLDFCILCGTDYNSNINKVGNVSAFKLINDHKNIESIDNKYDTSILNYTKVRNLFTNFDDCDNIDILHSTKPDYDKLTEFISLNDIEYSVEDIKTRLSNKIIF